MVLFSIMIFSIIFIDSDGTRSESQTSAPFTHKVDKSGFTRQQAMKSIEKFAQSEINGYLKKYQLESLRFERKKWVAYYISKIPMPGGHFMIIMDDITGDLEFVPGE